MRVGMVLGGGVLCASFATGCVNTADAARDRAAREFDCSRDEVQVKWIEQLGSEDVYRVRACGEETNYVCSDISGQCRRETAPKE